MKKLNVKKASQSLQELMDATVEQKTTLGAMCIIHQEGRPILELVSGKATIDGREMNGRSIFRLASMSKNICGIAILQEMDKGKLSLDTKLSDFFPGFQDKWVARITDDRRLVPDHKAETELTLKHLVTHTNGLGTMSLSLGEGGDDTDLGTVTEYYANTALLDFEPGTRWGYSGFAAFDVMGHMIEVLEDMPYADYVKKYITAPMEMEDTGFFLNDEQWGRAVDVLSHDADGNNIVTEVEKRCINPLAKPTRTAPGGGMASTPYDYIKINDMLVKGGLHNGHRILSEEAVKLMGTPLIPQGLPGMFFPWMTFGVCVYVRKGVPHMPDGCFGWGGMYGTYTWTDPVNKLGVIWMKNSNVLASVIEPTGERAFETAVYSALE